MSLEINLDPLRKTHMLIATPCYGGMAMCTYHRSLEQLQATFNAYEIPFSIQTMYNESLISRGRNTITDMFLQGPYTHLMFIDSDIQFDPVDVLALLHFDKNIIGGAYPLKAIHWDLVKKAVLANPDINPEDIVKCGVRYSAHFKNDVETVTLGGQTPVSVKELATGFMMIKREVFEKMAPLRPKYNPDIQQAGGAYIPSKEVTDFWGVGVHEGRYESEDYSFCRVWRDMGGEIFLCPWMKLSHMGSFNFPGDLEFAIKTLGELH